MTAVRARRHLAAAAGLAAVLGTTPAVAADPLSFSMDVAHQRSDLDYDDGREIETRETRVGVSLWEPLSAHVDGGLILGVNLVTQDGDPATEGEDLTGGYGGLAVRGEWPLTRTLAVTGEAGWRYYRASASRDTGDITLSRHEGDLRAGLAADLDAVTLSGGLLYTLTDGEREIEDVDTQGFDTDHAAGAYAGISLDTGGGGRVGVEAVTGPWNGVRVVFARRFF
ncbi:hypothetical protein KBTX_01375 [wastewater metagenome]|uniref:Outer membrane protein beta-barrel domain-containing protein n=4 Tax=root TaxID=1 RepID=A0A5B8R8K3_9ZZZZ|nr:hypothetical protein KBTEX_01375 [uncultured organism]